VPVAAWPSHHGEARAARHLIDEKTPKDDANGVIHWWDIHINKDSTYKECVNSIVKHPPRRRPQKKTTGRGVEGRSGLIANKLPSPLIHWYPEPHMRGGKELLCDGVLA